jgi:hypothetical protein
MMLFKNVLVIGGKGAAEVRHLRKFNHYIIKSALNSIRSLLSELQRF